MKQRETYIKVLGFMGVVMVDAISIGVAVGGSGWMVVVGIIGAVAFTGAGILLAWPFLNKLKNMVYAFCKQLWDVNNGLFLVVDDFWVDNAKQRFVIACRIISLRFNDIHIDGGCLTLSTTNIESMGFALGAGFTVKNSNITRIPSIQYMASSPYQDWYERLKKGNLLEIGIRFKGYVANKIVAIESKFKTRLSLP